LHAGSDESTLDAVAGLRLSHEAHLSSLKDAHEKELASHRSYIAFLEKRQRIVPNDFHNSEVRGHSRKDREGSSAEMLQLNRTIEKARENEKALKNSIADLEARLVTANNERTDVLEGFHDACAKIQELTERSETSILEPPNTRHKRSTSDVGSFMARSNPLWQQLQDLRRAVANKDAQAHRLEQSLTAKNDASQSQLGLQSSRISDLENALEKHREIAANARADSERYNALLHHELRRQSRTAAERAHANTPKIEAEAFVVAAEKMIRLKAQNGALKTTPKNKDSADAQQAGLAQVLERELEHCIKEIIMYKSVDLSVSLVRDLVLTIPQQARGERLPQRFEKSASQDCRSSGYRSSATAYTGWWECCEWQKPLDPRATT
jgi:hypothetical protein